MKKIGLGLQKGGTGKTTISVSLASELAKLGLRVLLIDADPQGNATSALLKEVQSEFADVLLDKDTMENAIVPVPNVENLCILATDPSSDELRNYKKSGQVASEIYKIDDLLKGIDEYFDYCIIDTSPDFSPLEQNIWVACDEIIPVINADNFAFDGLSIFMNNLNKWSKSIRVNFNVKTLVVNKFNASMSLDGKIKEMIEKGSQGKNIIVIPQDQAFKVAQFNQVVPVGKEKTQEAIKKLSEVVK